MSTLHNESTDRLFKVIMSLETLDECYDFFSDVCTVKEILDMSQRLDTAFLLESGASYQEITKEVGISTATIGRVSRCLNYGSGGYKKAIEKEKNKRSES